MSDVDGTAAPQVGGKAPPPPKGKGKGPPVPKGKGAPPAKAAEAVASAEAASEPAAVEKTSAEHTPVEDVPAVSAAESKAPPPKGKGKGPPAPKGKGAPPPPKAAEPVTDAEGSTAAAEKASAESAPQEPVPASTALPAKGKGKVPPAPKGKGAPPPPKAGEAPTDAEASPAAGGTAAPAKGKGKGPPAPKGKGVPPPPKAGEAPADAEAPPAAVGADTMPGDKAAAVAPESTEPQAAKGKGKAKGGPPPKAKAKGLGYKEKKEAELRALEDRLSADQGFSGKVLTAEESHIIEEKGTEDQGAGEYNKFEPVRGYFACRKCGQPIYSCQSKFESGCGWPAFDKCYTGSIDVKVEDDGTGRTEIKCAKCAGHLGHVFLEPGQHGKARSDQRHCANSLALQYLKHDPPAGLTEGVLVLPTPIESSEKVETPGTVTVELETPGDGVTFAKIGDSAAIHYRGLLAANNKEFDSSLGGDPFEFKVGEGTVIKGWEEGVQQMSLGSKAKLLVPASLGYGAKGMAGAIPPNADLIFHVELVSINLKDMYTESVASKEAQYQAHLAQHAPPDIIVTDSAAGAPPAGPIQEPSRDRVQSIAARCAAPDEVSQAEDEEYAALMSRWESKKGRSAATVRFAPGSFEHQPSDGVEADELVAPPAQLTRAPAATDYVTPPLAPPSSNFHMPDPGASVGNVNYGKLDVFRKGVRRAISMQTVAAAFRSRDAGFSAANAVGVLEVTLTEDEEHEALMARWEQRRGRTTTVGADLVNKPDAISAEPVDEVLPPVPAMRWRTQPGTPGPAPEGWNPPENGDEAFATATKRTRLARAVTQDVSSMSPKASMRERAQTEAAVVQTVAKHFKETMVATQTFTFSSGPPQKADAAFVDAVAELKSCISRLTEAIQQADRKSAGALKASLAALVANATATADKIGV